MGMSNEIILQGVTRDELIESLSRSLFDKMQYLPSYMPELPNRLLDKKAAAEYLCLSVRQIDNLTKVGKIKYIRIESNVRFRLSDMDAYVEKHQARVKK